MASPPAASGCDTLCDDRVDFAPTQRPQVASWLRQDRTEARVLAERRTVHAPLGAGSPQRLPIEYSAGHRTQDLDEDALRVGQLGRRIQLDRRPDPTIFMTER